MKASLRHRIDSVHTPVLEEWHAAWTGWGGAVTQRWAGLDPHARTRHDALFQPLYQQWGEAVVSGELSSFLSRGAALAKWWEAAPFLWDWLWEIQQLWAGENLQVWPNRVPLPPDVPEGALERLISGMNTAEDCALLLAVCAVQLRRGV